MQLRNRDSWFSIEIFKTHSKQMKNFDDFFEILNSDMFCLYPTSQGNGDWTMELKFFIKK